MNLQEWPSIFFFYVSSSSKRMTRFLDKIIKANFLLNFCNADVSRSAKWPMILLNACHHCILEKPMPIECLSHQTVWIKLFAWWMLGCIWNTDLNDKMLESLAIEMSLNICLSVQHQNLSNSFHQNDWIIDRHHGWPWRFCPHQIDLIVAFYDPHKWLNYWMFIAFPNTKFRFSRHTECLYEYATTKYLTANDCWVCPRIDWLI